jgi:integrase
MIQYRLPSGKQKKESVGKYSDLDGYSLADAQKLMAQRTTLINEGREEELFAKKKEVAWTFNQLAEWWLNLPPTKARSDQERLTYAFTKFNQVFGERLVKGIKLSELRGYQTQRRQEGQADATTDHESHSAAKAAIKALYQDGEIGLETWRTWENFKKLIRGKKAKKKYARKRVLELEEYCRLDPHLPRHLKDLVEFALFSGMRKSEMLPSRNNGEPNSGLAMSQVDYKNKVIRLTETKTGIPRDIPITGELEAILKRIITPWHVGPVFTYRGKPFSDVRRGLVKACREAGISYGKKVEGGFVFSDLRRTAKTLMARAGIDKAYRDALLGHESQDMDRHYLHPDFEKDLRAAMEKYHVWLVDQIESVTTTDAQVNG